MGSFLSRRLLIATLLSFALLNVVLFAAMRWHDIVFGEQWMLIAVVEVIGLVVALVIGLKITHLGYEAETRRVRKTRGLTGLYRK
jgi:uncharacterized membrane protein YhaH (DUF805 family)